MDDLALTTEADMIFELMRRCEGDFGWLSGVIPELFELNPSLFDDDDVFDGCNHFSRSLKKENTIRMGSTEKWHS